MAELTSEVWQHFIKSYDGATCRYCSVVMAYPGGSTSNLKRHLNRRHPTVPPPTSNNVSCAFGRNAPPSYEISKRTQDTNTTLKPWTHETSTKSNQCRLQMLRKKALIDLFKCMETSCAFTTNDGMEMEHHLLGHDPPKEVESCTLSCAYCTTATTTPRALVNHIRENHGQCRFQCLFCFYRALEAGNVLYHQHYHHSAVQNVTSTIVELPSTERQPKTDYLIGMCTSFQSNHELLTCTVCHTTHASISLFKEHVYQHRESAIKCPICSIQILKEDALDHLNHHRTCFRKCLYCKTTCKSKLLMYRHLSDCHLNKAMFYALKMQRFDKPYDIFVLENLGFDVPPSRILLATYVTGGVLLTPKLTPDTFKKTRNKHTVVKRVEQTDLPKIVKVQGGIVFSEDGSILQATDSVQTQSSEPDKVISETRDVGNAVSTPSIRLHASDRAESIYSPISSNLPKNVTASVDTETDAVETQPPVKADKNMAEAVAKSNIVKPILVEVNNFKKSATSKTNVIVAGLPKKATLSTVTSVRVVPTSKVRTAALEYSDTGAVSIAANNVANVVSPSVNIASVATHSDRAPNLDIQPPLVCNSDSDNTGKVISTKNFINTQHFESMIKTNSQVVLNRSKIVVKNFNSLSASTATGPSIRATIPSVTRNTDCAVSVSVVGADASELKHGAASIIVKETKTDSARNSAEGSGTMRTKHIDINVRDFRSRTSVSLPVPNGNRNPTVSRSCVKLTRLEDGSLVLKFPSKSNPTTKPPGNADMARIVSKSDVVQPVISGGNKVKPFATLVPVAGFTKKMPPTTHNAFVHARSASIRHSKDEQKKTDDTAGCEISPTQTIESNQTISKKQTTSASAIGLRKLSVLPEFACQSSNASILKPAQTSTKPTSSATQIKGNVVKIDMVLKDLPTWNRYGIDLNSLELKNLLSHWPFLADRIDIFYRSLKWAVSRNKIKEVDCFVCGVKDCHNCFQTISSLKAHMVKNHFVLKTAAIACKHCDCLLCGIDAYVTHVNMHIMCRFVCFMCNHNHFLLNKMVDHMKKEHKCKVAMLSFVHPQHVNPLKDLIILMPADLNPNSLVKYMNLTIQSGNNEVVAKANWLPKQANINDLYNCGFCKEALGNKLALKKHLLLCDKRSFDYYPCAHCEMRFINWTEILDGICRHLYFHGENLYECSVCEYKHFVDRNVLQHVKKHSESYPLVKLNVIRETNQLWKCSLCHYQTAFQQGVMEHIQCEHNLPGERFMCSLCYGRMLTTSQTVNHCVYRHHGKQVTMIEMYHPETSGCNETANHPIETPRRLNVQDISYEKVNNIKAQQLASQSKVQHVNSANSDTPEAKADCSTEPLIDVIKEELEIIDSNETVVIPNLRKRKHECLNNDDMCEHFTSDEDLAKEQENDEILETVPETMTKDVDKTRHALRADDSVAVDPAAKKVSLVQVGNCDEEPQMKRQRRDHTSNTPTLSPLYSPSSSSPASQRRASRRVAAKSEAYNRWLESVKYCCQSCKKSFDSFSDFKTHGLVSNEDENNANEVFCISSGSQRNFWLLPRARCFYCNEQDTCATLMLHCREKHHANSFACIDLSDPLKCGLCLYRNECGKTERFLKHFQACHNESRIDYCEYINESYFEWALSLGRNTLFDGPVQKHVMLYICSICYEENLSETSMGMHVAKHVLKFSCPQCHEEFKHLKVLYYHFLAIHRKELVVPSTAANDYDEQLLEVLMVFQNGLIVSKREAQHTSIASIIALKAGFQRYYSEQLRILESYKEALLFPMFTGDEAIEANAEHTCKTFIQHQVAHPVLALKHLSNEEVSSSHGLVPKSQHAINKS